MQKLSNNLFLLIANLSQQKDKQSIIKMFIQGLNSFIPQNFFSWYEDVEGESFLEVSTQKKVYGEIKFSEASLTDDPIVFATLQNAAQMLAVILERQEQQQLLNDEKKHLENTVSNRTKELEQQMQEYEALSEEYKALNDQLKDALEKTENSEEKLRSILENSTNVFFRHNTAHELTYLSPQIKNVLGYTPEEAKIKWMRLTTDNPINKRGYELTVKAIESGKPQEPYELELFHKSGSKVYIEVREAPLVKNGKTVAVVGALVDITKRKIALEKLLENRYYLKKAQEIGKIGTWELDIKKDILRWTEENYKIFEIPENQSLNTEKFFKCVHPDDKEFVMKSWNNALRGEEYNIEHKLLVNDKVKWVREKAQVEFNDDGEPFKAIGFTQDITERKKSEQELRDSETRFKSYVESAPDGIFLVNDKGEYIDVNPSACRITGYSKSELLNMNITDLVPIEKRNNSRERFEHLKEKGELKGVTMFVTKNNERRYWSIDAVKLSEKEFLGFARDFTVQQHAEQKIKAQNEELEKSLAQIKRTTEELTIAKERAEESDRLKSAFLANMSHEIRTPMNGILGFIDLLLSAKVSGEKRSQYLSMMQKSGDRLLYTINDIIEISKIEAGQIVNKAAPENINEILSFFHSFFMHEAERKGLKLKLKTALDDKTLINIDRTKLEIIITNLIKNALKFTAKGEIEFGYHKKDDQLEFFVKDTGVGIPENRMDAIFDRFVHADLNISRPYEGSGLGLSIAKAYTEMLGGKINATSEVGKGSTFFFTIAYEPVQLEDISLNTAEEDKKENSVHGEEKLILVAEDDDTSKALLESILSAEKFRLVYTKNGKETIEMCRNNPDIDMILMDLKMPFLDGYEATKILREFFDKPIIAQTAYALPGDREKAIAAGCNDYITKPLKSNELLDMIRKHL